MEFRTPYRPVKAPFELSPERCAVLMGSCFSDNIAARMRFCGWNAENPLGTLYNPLSIAKVIDTLLFADNAEDVIEDSLFADTLATHSWLFDSKMSSASRQDTAGRIRKAARCLNASLQEAQALFITFGTAWCYSLAADPAYVVANCHKQPAALFHRFRASISQITSAWTLMATRLKERYPQLQIVFTVSPVRHLKDGFEGNARSKATLLLAVEEICNSLDFCHYFPAYEIINDDLRDYRFYAADMTHPSPQAVEYVWEIFKSTFIGPKGERLLKEGEKRIKAALHRPLIR